MFVLFCMFAFCLLLNTIKQVRTLVYDTEATGWNLLDDYFNPKQTDMTDVDTHIDIQLKLPYIACKSVCVCVCVCVRVCVRYIKQDPPTPNSTLKSNS